MGVDVSLCTKFCPFPLLSLRDMAGMCGLGATVGFSWQSLPVACALPALSSHYTLLCVCLV